MNLQQKRKLCYGLMSLIRHVSLGTMVKLLIYLTTNSVTKYRTCLKIKLLRENVVAEFRCDHGYRFRAQIADWWRFIGHFEPKTTALIRKVTRYNDVVIDIGAHIGLHTIHFAKIAKLVIALEPEPSNFRLLKENIKVNKASNVIALPIAASNYDGYIDLYISPSSGSHSVEVYNDLEMRASSKYIGKIKVPCIKIDTLLKMLGLSKADIVKIDVEGHEHKVLEGMTRILTNVPPRVLIIEIDKGSKLVDELRNRYGYRFVIKLDD